MDNLYKYRDLTRPESELTAPIAHTNERSQIWHQRLEHMNFRSLQALSTHNMVVGLPRMFPPEGVCKGCVLGKHHHKPFHSGKALVA
jgi:hypothetical protein